MEGLCDSSGARPGTGMLGLLNMLMHHRALLGISVLTEEHDFM